MQIHLETGSKKIAVVWFRSDLRVHDHPALIAAVATGLPVLGLYIHHPRLEGTSRFGFARMSELRRQFLAESLADLKASLAKLNIPLIQLAGRPSDCLDQVATQVEPAWIGFHQRFGTEEIEDQREVEVWARKQSAKVFKASAHCLVDEADLGSPVMAIPDLFTTFRKQVERHLVVKAPLPIPGAVRTPLRVEHSAGVQPTGGNSLRFSGGDAAGLKRLKHYLWDTDRLAIYKETRNGMLLEDDSSKFSPWLAHGCLSARTIYSEVRRYERDRQENDSTYWLIFELLWRDFFAYQLQKQGRRFFIASGIQGLNLPWKQNQSHIDAWIAGKTGFPLVDASMRELKETGYTSNRARQNVASFLCKNLGLDWRIGAEWYESQLLDYDPASNYGNWMYQAGVGHDAREFRLFNLVKQASQYDPGGDYARRWLPELRGVPAKDIYSPHPHQRKAAGYPEEMISFDQSAREHRSIYERVAGTGSIPTKNHGRDHRRVRR